MSLAWRFNVTNQNILLAGLLNHNYNLNKLLDNPNYKFTYYSAIWKSLVHGWTLCKKGITNLIGNGNATSFWNDTWCTDVPLSKLIHGPLPNLESNKTVSYYINAGTWSLDSLPFYLLDDIMDKIKSTFFPSLDKPDKSLWAHSQNGRFNTSLAYKFAQNLSLPNPLSRGTLSFPFIWKKPTYFN